MQQASVSDLEILESPVPLQDGSSCEEISHSSRRVPCTVCGSTGSEIVCPADDIKAQHDELRRFHESRLVSTVQARSVHETDLFGRVDFTQRYTTNVSRCLTCGLLFQNPRPTADVIADLYANDRYTDRYLLEEHQRQIPWAEEKLLTLAGWLWKFGRVRPRVVEVGSFVGGFLSVARTCGWDILGVDPGRQVVDFCCSRGLPIIHGRLHEAEVVPGSVDAITIWNTFDQLANPHLVLRTARTLLRPGGLLVIRVPNGECYRTLITARRRWRGASSRMFTAMLAWNNLLGFPYLYGYTGSTLDRLVAGYGMHRLGVYPDVLLPIAGPQHTTWARVEERVTKRLCRVFSLRRKTGRPTPLRLSPWCDHYYRLS